MKNLQVRLKSNNFENIWTYHVSASIHKATSIWPVWNHDDTKEILDEETGLWSGLTGMVGFTFSYIFSRLTF